MHCGASVGELYGSLVFHIHYLFPLTYISCNSSPIPRSSPPPTVVCKTTGREHLGKRLCRISNVCWCLFSNINWAHANLGFVVHTNSVSLQRNGSYCCRQRLGGGLKSCKLRMRVQNLGTNNWFSVSPTYSHLGTVSSSHGL